MPNLEVKNPIRQNLPSENFLALHNAKPPPPPLSFPRSKPPTSTLLRRHYSAEALISREPPHLVAEKCQHPSRHGHGAPSRCAPAFGITIWRTDQPTETAGGAPPTRAGRACKSGERRRRRRGRERGDGETILEGCCCAYGGWCVFD